MHETDPTGSVQPRTRSSDGRSSEQRSTEEQAFERAAAQLRPTWANGQARQQLGTPVSSPDGDAPISGTTPLPPAPVSLAPPAASAPSQSAASLPWAAHEGELPSAARAASAPDLRSHVVPPLSARAPEGALRPASALDAGTQPSTIELSEQIHEPDFLVDDQPVFAAAHSNFPAQPFTPFATDVTPAPKYGRRSGADETGDFSFTGPKRRLKVRLLAIGAAVCLALGGVWALASGGSDDATPPAASTPLAAPAPLAAPTPPAASTPSAPAAVAPAQLPMGRELPKSLAPAQPRDGIASANKRAAASSPTNGTSKVAGKATVPPRKAATRPVPASAKAAVKAPTKPAAKSAPVLARAPEGALRPAKSNKPAASTLKAKPQPKAAKPGKRVRLSTDVLDPWDK